MVMSTRTSLEAAKLLEQSILLDSVQLLNVGEPVTVGTQVTRSLTPVGNPIPGLVQTSVPQGAVESTTTNIYSVKVPQGTAWHAGQAVRVVACLMEPDLVGKVLLLDSVSRNGAALIRKGFASDSNVVNQEGKEVLA
ncbi:hypothetical protein SEA_CAPTAINREX_11 [Microbacterium phage CaptainRex]|nr:hypothetical protein SEA_LIBRIE_11 [Microbacterium phage Librie]WIC89842.1 hypothetical protein SEA_CAPTAINREX_11 [Microbacterium phage CaptainRex]